MQSFNPKYRGKDYLDQFYRLQRLYEKVLKVKNNENQLNQISIDEQEDCFYILFLIAINLRDWLIRSSDFDVKEIFYGDKAVKELQICNDFVNNFKHFDNSRNPQLDKDTYFISRSATVRIGLSKEDILKSDLIHVWYINSKGLQENANDVVEKCFQELRRYMIDKKYI